MSNKNQKTAESLNEKGFSLVEAVIAIFILTIGLLGTVAAITYALEYGAISRNVTRAKLEAVAEIEEIETLRNARRLDFKQIANVGDVNNTGSPNFFSGFNKLFTAISESPGPDGVNGTADDFRDPGADGVYGTPDDFDNYTLVREGFWKKIVITSLSDTMKKVEVRIRYTGRAGQMGEISGVSYINDEARITR